MSRDKKKCMKLQTRVEEERNNNEFIDELFKRLIPVFSEIMMDPYANYFCQKLLTLANEDHITKILEHIKHKFVEICINTHGTRAGQHLVEKMKLTKERIKVIK
jgi:pumilio RNA-binding family